ncbi:long-chain fatty acid--CoA ligase [Aquisediminimonas sediminicola]|uniref:long-chain fatty acid--CoA ligase n=1 Tax=Alteraquisediminimonas sediminicola TaxID=2676787 RepID=UPI001C8E1FF7|nr:long-chain fatty acid--CoA ligase [Aquisediminimonas sediminicola]
MDATMMRYPLTTQMILHRGERLFVDSQVSTFDGETMQVVSYGEIAHRARGLAGALRALGVVSGDRVGTFCWNSQAHLEAYLAVPAMGAVLHTLNVRLFAEQLDYIINHAADRVLLVDVALLPLLQPILPRLASVQDLIIIGEAEVPVAGFSGRVHGYDTLLAAHDPLIDWPALDENSAAVMCYTSGTTGHPKGVVYSHRSIFLHSMGSMGVDAFAISNHDRILMLPPMFHANAWGTPFSGWFAGSDFILPGPHLQPDKIARLIALCRPSFTAAVPTILNDMLQLHEHKPLDLSSFRVIISGGSAVSPALIERVKDAWGVDVVQGWGMTETSPMCVLSFPPRNAAPADSLHWRAKSGRPVAGMEVRIVDGEGQSLPEDGQTVGNLQLRGPWVAAGYYHQAADESPLSDDGWLRTGDAGSIDPQGFVTITDRTKDLIKSGGEWISSVEIEHCIGRFPGVMEVAVISVPDARWEERPLAVLAAADGRMLDFGELRQFLAKQIAKFMVPEYWAIVPSLPKTSVGKIDKKKLRREVESGALMYVCETRMCPEGKI